MIRTAGLAILAMWLLAPCAAAQTSLFKKDQQIKAPDPRLKKRPALTLFNDPAPQRKVWRKHDLVTVQILEITRGNVQANSTIRKETEVDVEINKFMRLSGFNVFAPGKATVKPDLGIAEDKPGIDIQADYERIGFGQTRRDQQLTGQITAEVVKVLPNGNLVVEARKVRQVSDDTETMVLSGIIRPDDVGKDNIILSHRIARLTVRYTAKGTTNDAQKPGLLSRIAEYLWPF